MGQIENIKKSISKENGELIERLDEIVKAEDGQESISNLLKHWEDYPQQKGEIEEMKEPCDLCHLIKLCEKYKNQTEIQQAYFLQSIKMQAEILLLRYDYFIRENEPKSNAHQSDSDTAVEKLKRYPELLKEDESFTDSNNKIKITDKDILSTNNNDDDKQIKEYFNKSVKWIQNFLGPVNEKQVSEQKKLEDSISEDSISVEKDAQEQDHKKLEDILSALRAIHDLLPENKKIASIQKILDENPEKISEQEFSSKLDYFLFQNYMKDISYCGFGYTRDWEWKIDQGNDCEEGICLFRNVSDERNENVSNNQNSSSGFEYVKEMLKKSGEHIAGNSESESLVSYSKDFLLDIYKYVKCKSDSSSSGLTIGLSDEGQINSVEGEISGEVKIAFVKGAIANVIKTEKEYDFYEYVGSTKHLTPTGFCIEPFYQEQYRDKNGRRLYNYQDYLERWMGYNAPRFPRHIADKKDEEVVTSQGYFKPEDGWTTLFKDNKLPDENMTSKVEYQVTFSVENFLYFLYCICRDGNENTIKKKLENSIKDIAKEQLKKSIKDIAKEQPKIDISSYKMVLNIPEKMIEQFKESDSEEDSERRINDTAESISTQIAQIICTRVTKDDSGKREKIRNLVSSEFIKNGIKQSAEKYAQKGLSQNSIYSPEDTSLTEWKKIFLGDLLNLI